MCWEYTVSSHFPPPPPYSVRAENAFRGSPNEQKMNCNVLLITNHYAFLTVFYLPFVLFAVIRVTMFQ